MESKLYVGNLPYSITEEQLSELFAQAGTVNSVKIIKDRDSGYSKGFAFVEMSSPEEAEKAISMFNAYKLGERELRVNQARPREERGEGFQRNRRRTSGGYQQRSGKRHDQEF
jgi:cold-inducible RNA-binding protein